MLVSRIFFEQVIKNLLLITFDSRASSTSTPASDLGPRPSAYWQLTSDSSSSYPYGYGRIGEDSGTAWNYYAADADH